jgi:hypothetical protein
MTGKMIVWEFRTHTLFINGSKSDKMEIIS